MDNKSSVDSQYNMKELYIYIWQHSAYHQIRTCFAALLTLPLALAPMEIQRRIFDDAISPKNVNLLILLVSIYAAVIVIQQLIKFVYNMLRAKTAEKTIRVLRNQLVDNTAESDVEDEGARVSMVTGEVEPVGSFAGDAFAQLITEGGVLVVVFAYMLYTEFWLAWVAALAFVPQAMLTPLVQKKINENSEKRIKHVRAVGDDTLAISTGEQSLDSRVTKRIGAIYILRMIISKLKFGLKAALNLLDHSADLAVLGFGGYLVITGESEIGVVVAFLSGLGQLRVPWRTLINYFRIASDAQLRFGMLREHL